MFETELAIVGIVYLEMIFSKNTANIIKESFLNALLKNKPLVPTVQMFPHISKLKDFDKDLNNFIEILDKDAYDARSITEIVKKNKKGIRMIGMLMAEILESLGGKINFGKGSSLKREDWKKLAKGLG